MTKIRIHAEKKCRKILRPESDFSPTVLMWYDRIHTYLQLIRMKEGKTKNTANILRFACQQHINALEELTLVKLKDGLCPNKEGRSKEAGKGLMASTSKRLFDRCSGKKPAQASSRNQAEMPEGREQKNVIPDQADGKSSSEPKRAEGTKSSQRGGEGIRGARRCATGNSAGV